MKCSKNMGGSSSKRSSGTFAWIVYCKTYYSISSSGSSISSSGSSISSSSSSSNVVIVVAASISVNVGLSRTRG